jgi:hypothetical protein
MRKLHIGYGITNDGRRELLHVFEYESDAEEWMRLCMEEGGFLSMRTALCRRRSSAHKSVYIESVKYTTTRDIRNLSNPAS